MQIRAMLAEPTFDTKSEQDFVMHYISRHEHKVAKIYLIAASFGWLLPAIATWQGLLATKEGLLLTWFHITKSLVALTLLCFVQSTRILRFSVLSMLVSAQFVWMLAAILSQPVSGNHYSLPAMWVGYILIGNFLLPFRSYTHNLVFLITLATSYLGLKHYPERDLSAIIIAVSIVISQNYRIYIQRMIKSTSIRAYREQSRYIPRQVLMKAARENKSILELFAPTKRFCICICSDWRKFQSLSSGISMTTLGQGLSSYYQSLVDKLYQRFPDGQFFVDWIADELFLVVFAQDERVDRELVQESFLMSQEILKFRKEFFIQNGFPAGADVGISCGVASVGVFGNGGIAKATAFGAVPGVARDLQDIAKKLRRTHGAFDRIVMTESFLSFLTKTPDNLLPIEPHDVDDPNATIEERVFVWPGVVHNAEARGLVAL